MSQKTSQPKNKPIQNLEFLFEELNEEQADKVAGGGAPVKRERSQPPSR